MMSRTAAFSSWSWRTLLPITGEPARIAWANLAACLLKPTSGEAIDKVGEICFLRK